MCGQLFVAALNYALNFEFINVLYISDNLRLLLFYEIFHQATFLTLFSNVLLWPPISLSLSCVYWFHALQLVIVIHLRRVFSWLMSIVVIKNWP